MSILMFAQNWLNYRTYLSHFIVCESGISALELAHCLIEPSYAIKYFVCQHSLCLFLFSIQMLYRLFVLSFLVCTHVFFFQFSETEYCFFRYLKSWLYYKLCSQILFLLIFSILPVNYKLKSLGKNFSWKFKFESKTQLSG